MIENMGGTGINAIGWLLHSRRHSAKEPVMANKAGRPW
jgi:hypothetical protein